MSEPLLPGDEGEGSPPLTSTQGRSCQCWGPTTPLAVTGCSHELQPSGQTGEPLVSTEGKQGDGEQPAWICHEQIISSNLISLWDRGSWWQRGRMQVMWHWPFICAHEQRRSGTCCRVSPRASSGPGTSHPSRAPCEAAGIRCGCWWMQLERRMQTAGPAPALALSAGAVAVGLG